jgi:hypothetical protein
MRTVFLSVLPRNIFNEEVLTSPRVFATREGAQADCNNLNKTRSNKFIVIELEVNQ